MASIPGAAIRRCAADVDEGKYLRVTASYTGRSTTMAQDGACDVGLPGAGGGPRRKERVP